MQQSDLLFGWKGEKTRYKQIWGPGNDFAIGNTHWHLSLGQQTFVRVLTEHLQALPEVTGNSPSCLGTKDCILKQVVQPLLKPIHSQCQPSQLSCQTFLFIILKSRVWIRTFWGVKPFTQLCSLQAHKPSCPAQEISCLWVKWVFVGAGHKHMDFLASACLFVQCSRRVSLFRCLSEPFANN